MSKYLRKFETEAEYSAATIYRPSVSLIADDMTVIFDPKHDYSKDYFTIVALGDNLELVWSTDFTNLLSYSTDNGSTWSEPTPYFEVTLANSGDTIMFKGSGMTSSGTKAIGKLQPIYFDVDYKVQGNIMSLLFGDNFVGQTDLSGYVSAFSFFFQGLSKAMPNERLLSVENLVLPATTLAERCYANMFLNCTSLTNVPELPATTLATECCSSMFKGCTSLTTAPELPATTLAGGCYYNMFNGCTSLTTAPVLSSTTLVSGCCQNMFSGCTSLTTAPILPAETIKSQSYRGMFNGCTSLSAITCLATDISETRCTFQWVSGVAANGTFTQAASMSSWTTGDSGIPSGWTVQDYTE